MAYRTPRGRSGLTRAAVVGEERHNIFRPDTTQISVADRVSKLFLTTASLDTTVEARIRWLLGEIEKSRFDDNALQLVAYASSLEKEKDGRLLDLVLDLVFWKFREDLASRSIFSRLCQIIAQEILPTVQDGRSCDVDGQPVMGRNLVHQYILERCHREIGRMWLEKCRADNASLTRNDEAVVVANQATKQWAGLVRFIHALFEKSLVGEEVMHLCIERLLSPNKLALEEISALGDILSQVPGRRQYQSRERMNAYYVRIKELASSSGDSVLQLCLSEWVLPPGSSDSSATLPNDLHLSVLQSGPTKPILEYKKFEQDLQTQPESQHVEINTPAPSSQSKLKITPTTPLSVIMDIFGLFSNVKDYTSELNKASYCSSSPVAFGGFSEVYQATLRHGAQVAVKCVKSSVSSDYEAVKHTARELDAWSKLRHANILELLGMALFNGRLAMISDWMEQGSVVAFINSKSETVDRFDMSKQVVGAVAFLHQQNVVHGDLKGANILVAKDCTLKIADFGLTIVHEGKFQFSATDPGGGTMRWMAPELFKEHAKRTPQTDIYALGMTLLEIFTGKEPFHEVSGHLIPILVTQERKVPVRPNYLLTSSEQNNIFWEILTKCWAFEPDKRAEAAELESLIKSVRM